MASARRSSWVKQQLIVSSAIALVFSASVADAQTRRQAQAPSIEVHLEVLESLKASAVAPAPRPAPVPAPSAPAAAPFGKPSPRPAPVPRAAPAPKAVEKPPVAPKPVEPVKPATPVSKPAPVAPPAPVPKELPKQAPKETPKPVVKEEPKKEAPKKPEKPAFSTYQPDSEASDPRPALVEPKSAVKKAEKPKEKPKAEEKPAPKETPPAVKEEIQKPEPAKEAPKPKVEDKAEAPKVPLLPEIKPEDKKTVDLSDDLLDMPPMPKKPDAASSVPADTRKLAAPPAGLVLPDLDIKTPEPPKVDEKPEALPTLPELKEATPPAALPVLPLPDVSEKAAEPELPPLKPEEKQPQAPAVPELPESKKPLPALPEGIRDLPTLDDDAKVKKDELPVISAPELPKDLPKPVEVAPEVAELEALPALEKAEKQALVPEPEKPGLFGGLVAQIKGLFGGEEAAPAAQAVEAPVVLPKAQIVEPVKETPPPAPSALPDVRSLKTEPAEKDLSELPPLPKEVVPEVPVATQSNKTLPSLDAIMSADRRAPVADEQESLSSLDDTPAPPPVKITRGEEKAPAEKPSKPVAPAKAAPEKEAKPAAKKVDTKVVPVQETELPPLPMPPLAELPPLPSPAAPAEKTPAPTTSAADKPVAAPVKEEKAPAAEEKPAAPKAAAKGVESGRDDKGRSYTRLYYDLESTAVGKDAHAALDGLAKTLQRDDSKKLRLEAYAGENNDQKSVAKRVSLARALAVRAYLIDAGIDASRVNVKAMGYVESPLPAERVDIFVE